MLKNIVAIGVSVLGAALLMPTAFAQPGGNRPGYGSGGPDRIECSSNDFRYKRCNVDWNKADLVRQTSNTRCIKGQNWGVDRKGLWVDRGCGGVFVNAGRGGSGHGPGGNHGNAGPGWNRDIRLTCSSTDFRYRMCQVDLGSAGRARIDRQLSSTACIEGRTWGSNRAGIWVDRGCSATFVVTRGGR